jgi:hypothetical protein
MSEMNRQDARAAKRKTHGLSPFFLAFLASWRFLLPPPRLAVPFIGVLFWSADARATQSFPGVVDATLALPTRGVETIFPPDGCHLCHVEEAGGKPHTPFGTLVYASGAIPYQDSTLVAALNSIEMNQPQLIADLRAGMDPNADMSTSSQNLDPVISYGCGSIARGPCSPCGAVLVLGSGLVALVRRRRGRPPE